MKQRITLSKNNIINMFNEDYFFEEMPVINYFYNPGLRYPYCIVHSANNGSTNYSVMYLRESEFREYLISILKEKGYSSISLDCHLDGTFKVRCSVAEFSRRRKR